MNARLARVRRLNRGLATTLAVAGVVLTAAGVATATSARTSSSYVITATKTIDGYRVGSAFTNAKRRFGGPRSSSQDRAACVASWANGVTIAWQRRPQYVKWERACVTFVWSKVTGRLWSTDKGLRVGASQSQVKKLYNVATSKKSGAYTVWTLAKSSGNSLQAWVKGGRVSYFRVVHA